MTRRIIRELKDSRAGKSSTHGRRPPIEDLEIQLEGMKALDVSVFGPAILRTRFDYILKSRPLDVSLQETVAKELPITSSPKEQRLCDAAAWIRLQNNQAFLRSVDTIVHNFIRVQSPNAASEAPPRSVKSRIDKGSTRDASIVGSGSDSQEAEDSEAHSGDASPGHLDSEASAASDEDEAVAPDTGPRARQSSSSRFLPTLAAGYTEGDGSASASAVDDPIYERQEKEALRKNRRGQRARRAIWEKKYGKGAKHLRRPNGPEQTPKAPVQPLQPFNSLSSAATEAPPKPRKVLHPSWELKRKEKELADVLTAPKGKKIVFE